MDMKVAFWLAVIVAVVVLVIVLRLQITTDITVPLTEGKISYFNLLFDVVVGIFTVWGLYWAVSELALRPELDLDIEGQGGTDVLEWNEVSSIKLRGITTCWLYLTNARPKAARLVRIVFFVYNAPPSFFVSGNCQHHDGTISEFYWLDEEEGLLSGSVQYPENFVVYKGERLDAGTIIIKWPLEDTIPKKVIFRAELHSLESEPKAVDITLPIRRAGSDF